jgi:hypothetical protein
MTINVSPDPRLQFFGNDGKPLVGGKLYTYAAGTTTLLATYIDWYGVTPNTNPIILDSRGEASVWLGTARYKFVLKDANDVEVYTQNNLIMSPGADGAGAYGTWPIDISGNAATATVATTVASGAAVTSITGAGLYGFTLTGGPITSTGTFTVTPPAPGATGNHMVSDGTNWVSSAFSGGGAPSVAIFTSTGNWTVPAGVTKCKVTVIAGGGGGNANATWAGGGGSGGGTSIKWISGLTPSAVITCTVGTGGAAAANGNSSSFGTYCSATGGSAGSSSPVAGVNGGVGSGGDLNIQGGSGGYSSTVTGIGNGSGPGGGTFIAPYVYALGPNSSSGVAGGLYGGGGGGTTTGSGGAGANGVIIIEY